MALNQMKVESNKQIFFQIFNKKPTKSKKTEPSIRQNCNIVKYIIINNKQIVDWKARGRLLSLVLWPKGGVGGLLFNLSEEKWMN